LFYYDYDLNYRYASVVAIESPSKLDDEQWLAYWIIYSFLTLGEMLAQPALEWLEF
jgi:receptor expression-enhancing protein 5/6